MAKLITQHMALRTSLYLEQRPSIIAATAVILALNICLSESLVTALNLDILTTVRKVPGSGAFGLWSEKIQSVTRIKSSELSMLYKSLVQQLDSDMLKGLLSKDQDIWL